MKEDIEYTELPRFQEYVQKSKIFQKFQYGSLKGESNNNIVLSNNRLFEINTFSHSLEFLAVTCTDIKTGLLYATNFGHEGLTKIITQQDQQIFDVCRKLAEKIQDEILKEAAKKYKMKY